MGDRVNNENDRTDQERAPEPESARPPEPVRPEPDSDLEDPDMRLSATGVASSDVEQDIPPLVDVPPPAQALAPEHEIREVEGDFDDANAGATTSGSRVGLWWRRLWKRT